ncbi:hypothetical protein EPICR_140004 [Candidatus Desulfarcum epimagneticum]|uniref:Fibronectin type-III domain-containing protein n=1 Tax=uncultured Desulfobacteraceae bacterium TaxID=218296 RepID=A0A484HEU8_9BACT|nr:hypothetical protein EPICR_140004 [uncultured Desulfobacteraceae bacterium]
MIRTLKFNGVDTYISLGGSAALKGLCPGAFAIEAWIKPEIRQEWTAFAGALKDTGADEKGWALGMASGRLAFGLASESGKKLVWARAKKEIPAGKWRHVAGVYDGKAIKLYVDGDLEAEEKNSGPILYPGSGEFVIGAYKDADEFYPFMGNIAEVRLWKAARTADSLDVSKGYRLNPKDHPDLAGYWPVIDGAGNAAWNWVEAGPKGDIKGKAVWEDHGGLNLTGHVPVPAPPGGLKSEDIRDEGFTAQWDAAPSAVKYVLEAAEDKDFKTPVQGYGALETVESSVGITGLESGKTYFWRVSCKGGEETGKPGAVQEVKTRIFAIPDANWAVSIPEDKANASLISFGKIENVKKSLPAKAFTAEVWVRPDDFEESGIFGVIGKDGEEQKGWLLGIKNKKFCFSVSGKDTADAGETGVMTDLVSRRTFMAGAWRHVAGVYSGKEMELYVDGERICGTKKASGDVSYPADEKGDFWAGMTLGVDGKPKGFKGMMSEIRLWNEALSPGDIQKRMEYRIYEPGEEKSLLGCWPLTRGSGYDAADIKGSVKGKLDGKAAWADAEGLCLFWPLEDAVQTAAGLRHTVALKSDGTVWAWGAGSRGQLGDGTRKPRYSPVMVKDSEGKKYLTRIKEIAVGHFHSAAVDEDGKVWAWGDHSLSQLGNDDLKESSSPLPVRAGLTGVKSVSALADFTLALKNDGTVWGWGANDRSQLGNDKATAGEKSVKPLQVKADNSYSHLENIVRIAAGKYHGAALDKIGKVWIWGDNEKKQLGAAPSIQAVLMKNRDGEELEGITSIAAGMWHTLACDKGGRAYGWGDNEHGQAGGKTEMAHEAPEPLVDENGDPLSGVQKVFAGYDHSMAETGKGTLIWGRNDHDQLGDGTGKDRGVPRAVKGRDGKAVKAKTIAAGRSHTAAVLPDGSVFAWGSAVMGRLGDGEAKERGVIHFGHACESSFAVKKDGSLWAWGRNSQNSLGINSTKDQSIPIQVPGIDGEGKLKGVKAVDGMKGWDSYKHTFALALLEGGRICGWGGNNYGQLGTGNTTQRPHPTYVMKDENNVFEENALQVAVGEVHGAALTEDGRVWSWGNNTHGELGVGTTGNKKDYYYPQKVDIDQAVEITACQHNIFIRKEDGTLWGTGWNSFGDLGQGDTAHRNTFVQIPGLEHIVAVSGGSHHTLALDAHGHVWAWGHNTYGQVGNNAKTHQKSPVRVVSPSGSAGEYLEDVIAISAGDWHSMAVKADGTVWNWGAYGQGRLGRALSGHQTRPGQVRFGDESVFLLGIRRVLGGHNTSFAVDEDGVLWSWGQGNNGERGDGKTHEIQTYPVKALL